jgi:hypothetical protein
LTVNTTARHGPFRGPIDTIIVAPMENRSLDHRLGFSQPASDGVAAVDGSTLAPMSTAA